MKLRDLRIQLFLHAALRSLQEDSQQFTAQVSRRFMPTKMREKIASIAQHLPESAIRNTGAILADRPDLLSTQSNASLQTHARELWNRGDIDAALATLNPQSPLFTRLADEWALIADSTPLALEPFAIEPPQPQCSHRTSQLDVLHVLTNSLPYTQSGYTIRSHRLLSAQQSAGINLEAVTRIGYPVTIGNLKVPDVSTVDAVTYRRLLPTSLERMPRARTIQHASLLTSLALELKPTVLHTTTDYRNGLATEATAHYLDIPWVYEMRGQLEKSWVARQDPEYRQAAATSKRFFAWQSTETRLAQSADAVVVLSEIQRDELIARGVDSEKIKIMPNAFDWPEGVERISRVEARGLLGLPEADVWIGSISALVDYEGFDTLIRAISILRSRGINAKAAIVGDGVARPKLQALVRELDLHDHVFMPGRVSVNDSHTWYQALDLFAVPRKDTPVCRIITPIKPLEALACGTPVLVSDLPALQLAPSHGAGLAIEAERPEKWANAISTSMPSSSTYTKMAEAAGILASMQSWRSNALTSTTMYEEIS